MCLQVVSTTPDQIASVCMKLKAHLRRELKREGLERRINLNIVFYVAHVLKFTYRKELKIQFPASTKFQSISTMEEGLEMLHTVSPSTFLTTLPTYKIFLIISHLQSSKQRYLLGPSSTP